MMVAVILQHFITPAYTGRTNQSHALKMLYYKLQNHFYNGGKEEAEPLQSTKCDKKQNIKYKLQALHLVYRVRGIYSSDLRSSCKCYTLIVEW